MVASSVIEDVIPYYMVSPMSALPVALFQLFDVARVWLMAYVMLGRSSINFGCFKSLNTRCACLLKTHSPGGISGQAADIPVRLMCRQKRIPIFTRLPPLK